MKVNTVLLALCMTFSTASAWASIYVSPPIFNDLNCNADRTSCEATAVFTGFCDTDDHQGCQAKIDTRIRGVSPLKIWEQDLSFKEIFFKDEKTSYEIQISMHSPVSLPAKLNLDLTLHAENANDSSEFDDSAHYVCDSPAAVLFGCNLNVTEKSDINDISFSALGIKAISN